MPRFEAALQEAYAAGLLGKNVQGSGIDVDIHTFVGAGAYICGEETALLESLEGKQGKPRFKPPFPAAYGLYGAPTTINNTQSIASIPTILRKGAQWFADLGREGLRRHGDLLRVRPRREARQLRAAARASRSRSCSRSRAACAAGRKLKAVIPGGSSCPVVPAEKMMTLTMDFDTVKAAGSGLGTGATIVMDETTCMVQHAAPARALLLRRVVRPVHAVPRGHGLAATAC